MFPHKLQKSVDKAIELAKNNTAKFKLASVACDKKGNIISWGINSSKTHPLMGRMAYKNGHREQIYLHSEIECIIRAKREISYLIVVRILANGNFGMASPCPICNEAIRISKIKNIIYSNFYGSFTWEKRR